MDKNLSKLLDGAQVVAVICNQWGDTGKGKFSDLLTHSWADIVARGTGGNNAGHTVVVGEKVYKFHLLPSGIIHDAAGKISLLGNGMVIDPAVLVSELDHLDSLDLSYKNLLISKDAHVIMPYHVTRDQARHQNQQGGKGIGSTGRGIGPCYTDKVARHGIRMGDLPDEALLTERINKALKHYPEQEVSAAEIISELRPAIERLKPYIADTVGLIHQYKREGKKILLEGAQGLLLSVEYGSYPYVTSSDCSLNGTAAGVGLPASAVDLSLGVVKFPFMTRVGAGPFPTEFAGEKGEAYCRDESNVKEAELKAADISFSKEDGKIKYDHQDPKIISMINSDDEITSAIGLRLASAEYGTTTGRPRRVGWTDASAVKYSVGINGPKLVLTKADSLSGAKSFKLSFGYEVDGKEVPNFDHNEEFLRKAKPIYREYEGFDNLDGVTQYDQLPDSLKQAITDLEQFSGGEVVAVSIGPDRNETIFR